ncbi:MAG: CsbD family protein [bacterium]
MSDDLGTDGMKNQVKGAAKEAGGKLRNAAGGITGNTSEQFKGKAKELEGKAQRKVGEVERDIDRDNDV